jgi:biopolymer transport protein ExbD
MKFRNRGAPPQPGFQIAPMIDVIFNLLAFFVVTQVFAQWEMEMDVRLPTAQSAQLPERLPGEVIINIMQDGHVRVNQRDLDAAGLASLLRRVVGLFPGQPVVIRADRATAYEHVVRVLDICRQADIWNILFATAMYEEKGKTGP